MPKKRKKKMSGNAPEVTETVIQSPADASNVDELIAEGLGYYHENNFEPAKECFERALQTAPERADAHSLIGVILMAQGSTPESLTHFKAAAKLDPLLADYRFNIALAYFIMGDLDSSADAARAAVAIRPDYSEAWNTLGMIFEGREDWRNAKNVFEKAVQYDPEYAIGWINLCGVLRELKLYDESLEAGKRGVEFAPDMAQAYYNLAHCHDARGEQEQSVAQLDKCIELNPTFANAYSNQCRSLCAIGEFARAERVDRTAIEQDPQSTIAYVNLGLALIDQGKHHESIEMYQRALAIDPDHVEAHNNLAHSGLAVEGFSYGWEKYEWGIIIEHRTVLDTTTPLWNNEPLAGKRVHVMGEQGIGEQIMFSTMIQELATEGAEITYECQRRLAPIYARSWPDITIAELTEKSTSSIPDVEFDYKILVGSIGRWRRTTVTDFTPRDQFLQADPVLQAECRARYEALGDGPVIGISWKSKSPRLKNRKDIGMEHWHPIFDAASGATFVSLQYGEVADDIASAKRDLGIEIYEDPNIDALASLEQSAAQIAAVDFIITISNATVHLAGALGVPTLMMVGPVPPWHWFLEREDSLWYKSIRIFRRANEDDWAKTVHDVTEAMPALLSSVR